MNKVYGVIYKITNKKNNRVYIGQTKYNFRKRYGGLTIKHVYKKTHNTELKGDIEIYNDDKYWLIEPEVDIAYTAEELNEKESNLFMQYMWDNMVHVRREDLHSAGKEDIYDENTWYSYDRYIPRVLYNRVKPTHKKTKDKTKQYIYTTNKIPIMFTSRSKLKAYIEAQDENFHGNGRFFYRGYFDVELGCFYVHWDVKWRVVDNIKIPRVKNLKRCIRYIDFDSTQTLYNHLGKPIVTYTGHTYSVRRIYKPCRRILVNRFEVKR